MKRVIRLLTVCFPLVSIADTKEIDGFVWEFAQCCDDGVELRGQQEWTAPAVVPEISGSLAVPSQINGATVLSIGYFSFYNFKSLASVKIPETVKHIGHMAFAGCDALEALYLPVGLETIDGYAVTKECAGPVLEIFYPGNLNQWLRLIGTGWSSPIACPNRLYLSDGLLENVTLSACKDIGECAFFSCEGIRTLQICSDVASIGAYAFGGCSNLRSVEMVDGVTNIYVGAFSGCGALTSVRLSQALCSIGVRAFNGCKALRALEVPQAVRKIDDHAFIATGLESITFAGDAPVAGKDVFEFTATTVYAYDDTKGWPTDGQWQGRPLVLLDREAALKHKVLFDTDGGTPLPEELMRREGEPIGELPTVEKYGYEFMGWHSNSVEGVQFCDATIMPQGDLLLVAAWERKSYTITFESGVGSPVAPIVRLYQDPIGELPTIESPGRHFVGWFADPEGKGEQIKADMLVEGCMTLYAGWAKSCMVDGRVWVYDDVAGRVRIHSMQIDGDVSVPDALDGLPVRDIPDACFANCSNLTSVTLPASVTNIGAYAFYNCVKLKDVVFNEGLISIGDGAFAKCESIEKVTLPSTVQSIGSRLAMVNDVANVTEEMSTFYGFETNCLENIREIKEKIEGRSSNLSNRGCGVFEGCTALNEMKLNVGLKCIGAGAFKDCRTLSALFIPESVLSIGGQVETVKLTSEQSNMSVCGLLPGMTGAPSVLSSENYHVESRCMSHCDAGFLEGCSALTSVLLPGQLEYLGPNSFARCLKLTTVELPDSLTVINRGTFSQCENLLAVRFPADLELIGGDELPYLINEDSGSITTYEYGGRPVTTSYAQISISTNGTTGDRLVECGMTYSESVGVVEDCRWLPDPRDVRVPVDEVAFLDWFYRWKGSQVLNNIACPLTDDERNKVRTRFASVRPSEPSFGSPDCGVFYGCSSLREVCLPQSVRRIADYSFYDCCNLMKIELPKRLDLLGYQVFGGETALMDIATPWFDFCSLWEIFPSHSYVTNLVILSSPPHIMDPNDVFKFVMKDIRGEAFTLEEANARMIPLTVDEREQVGRMILEGLWITQDEVLYGFQNLKSLTLPEGLRSFDWTIGWWSTQKLLDVTLPNTLTSLGWRAFAGFPVEHITIPSSLQTIEDEAFLESNVCDVLFTGNAPCDVSPNVFVETSGWDPYYAAREDLVVSVYPGATGWDGEAESAALPTDGLWPAHAAVYKRRPIQFVRQPVSAALGGEGGADALTYFDATLDRLVTVPQTWLNSYGLLSVDAAGAASVSSLSPIASRSLYDSYVAGLDPTDEESQFKVKIKIVNNEPVITWEPELSPEEAAKRKYTVYGCTELGGDWYNVDEVPDDIKAQLCFFKIGVEMR